ncbi:hypothetical protein [Stenotrophomonas sp. Marseille-Q4652]|uniref:hypothetical protein n=1 Tax=Stenotrophomonas sp. Marseille-Q4652 TaxID=2866595 RepID=UPI001CE3CB80|nr:hypothetical protein [Stenotrophomonas sp. Marseille-Q4652]
MTPRQALICAALAFVGPALAQAITTDTAASAPVRAWMPGSEQVRDADYCEMTKASREARLAGLAHDKANGRRNTGSALDDPEKLRRFWDARVQRACGDAGAVEANDASLPTGDGT